MITLRLNKDTRVTLRGTGGVGIEQGPYMDSDPDYRRDFIELTRAEMTELVKTWIDQRLAVAADRPD